MVSTYHKYLLKLGFKPVKTAIGFSYKKKSGRNEYAKLSGIENLYSLVLVDEKGKAPDFVLFHRYIVEKREHICFLLLNSFIGDQLKQ